MTPYTLDYLDQSHDASWYHFKYIHGLINKGKPILTETELLEKMRGQWLANKTINIHSKETKMIGRFDIDVRDGFLYILESRHDQMIYALTEKGKMFFSYYKFL